MNIRRGAVAVAVLLAVSIAACGTDAASSPAPEPTSTSAASSPTPETTPTAPAPTPTPGVTPVGPLDPITVDPSANPDVFLAALPADEVACAESAVGGRDVVTQVISSFAFDSSAASYVPADDVEAMVGCLGEETIQRILIGQIDHIAGGLSSETVACMRSHATASAFLVIASPGEPLTDGFRDFSSLIFCSNASERAALETSGSEMLVEQRPGFVDSMECMVNRREADGTSVYEQLMALHIQLIDAQTSPFEDPEYMLTYARFVRVAVECGMMTDEDFEGTGFTATQSACMYDEAGAVFMAYQTALAVDRSALPDMTPLVAALDACRVSPEVLIRGVYGPPVWLDESGNYATAEPGPISEVPPLDELNLPMTQEELACLLSHVSEDALQEMMQTGEPPSNLFEALDACDLSLDQLFPRH